MLSTMTPTPKFDPQESPIRLPEEAFTLVYDNVTVYTQGFIPLLFENYELAKICADEIMSDEVAVDPEPLKPGEANKIYPKITSIKNLAVCYPTAIWVKDSKNWFSISLKEFDTSENPYDYDVKTRSVSKNPFCLVETEDGKLPDSGKMEQVVHLDNDIERILLFDNLDSAYQVAHDYNKAMGKSCIAIRVIAEAIDKNYGVRFTWGDGKQQDMTLDRYKRRAGLN